MLVMPVRPSLSATYLPCQSPVPLDGASQTISRVPRVPDTPKVPRVTTLVMPVRPHRKDDSAGVTGHRLNWPLAQAC